MDIIRDFGYGLRYQPHEYGHALHTAAEDVLVNSDREVDLVIAADDICRSCRHLRGRTVWRHDESGNGVFPKQAYNRDLDPVLWVNLELGTLTRMTAKEYRQCVRRHWDGIWLVSVHPGENVMDRRTSLIGRIKNWTWKGEDMSGFKRATRECSVSELNPRLLEAFEEYFSKHKLGDLTEKTLMCCETFSEKEKPGILDTLLTGNPGSTGFLGLILTDRRLVWARTVDRSKTTVFGADLNYIQVKAYSSRITKETELQISGYIGDSKEHIQGNLAMGPEEAARKFCEEALKAVEKINPSAKKKSLFS